MYKKDIECKIKEIFKKKFFLDLNKMKKEEENISLLDPSIGMMPRDLLTLFFELQECFKIKFEEKDILENRFDCYSNIINLVEEKQNSMSK